MTIQERILRTLEGEPGFLITFHLRPDGDALGAGLGLALWLRGRGAEVRVVSPRGVPAQYRSLPGADTVDPSFPPQAPEILVVLDTPELRRTGIAERSVADARLVMNVDHHPDNAMFGQLNLVDSDASSTALLVYEILSQSEHQIGADVASLLYVGVMTDTGGFRFGNTDARTFGAAAALVDLGANASLLATRVYGEQPLGRLKLLGMVLASAQRALDGRVSVMYLTEDMATATGADGDEIEGLASYGRLLEGVQVALLLREEQSRIRVSLRSNGDADVNLIAGRLGGGGHRAAAGAVLDGPMSRARSVVLAAVEEGLG